MLHQIQILLCFLVCLPNLSQASETDYEPPKVDLYLSYEPKNRWTDIWNNQLDENARNIICEQVGYVYDQYFVNDIEVKVVNFLMRKLKYTFGKEYREEIESIAEFVKNDCDDDRINEAVIFTLNLVYEVSAADFDKIPLRQKKLAEKISPEQDFYNLQNTSDADSEEIAEIVERFVLRRAKTFEYKNGNQACTSLFAWNSSENKTYAARNMDFNPYGPLKKMLYDIDVYENFGDETPIAKASTFIGYIGFWTNLRPGKFAVTMNERTYSRIAVNILNMLTAADQNMEAMESDQSFESKIVPISTKVRDTTVKCDSFICAFNSLSQSLIPAPCYIVLSGLTQEEGVLITKSSRTSDIQRVENQVSYPDLEWYIVETNFDYWENAPVSAEPDGSKNISRRDKIHSLMDGMTSEMVSVDNLFDALDQAPVHNYHTVYSTVMDIAEGTYKTLVREAIYEEQEK